MKCGSVAAGAGRQCAPAAPGRLCSRPLNFTVRRPPMKLIALVLGVIFALLGGLWLLQGLGLVHLRPILCFVDCVPIQEPSLTWAIIGFASLLLGSIVVLYSLKHHLRRSSNNRWRVP